jgi:hypothetical protein
MLVGTTRAVIITATKKSKKEGSLTFSNPYIKLAYLSQDNKAYVTRILLSSYVYFILYSEPLQSIDYKAMAQITSNNDGMNGSRIQNGATNSTQTDEVAVLNGKALAFF